MPFDSSANFSLVPSYLATTGQTILASQHNPPLEDIAAGLSTTLLRTGVAPMLANLPMNGNRVTGMGDGVADGDAVTLSQARSLAGNVAPDDFWSENAGSFVSGTGFVGSNGSGDFGIYGNGYRNSDGLWTSLGKNSSNYGLGIRFATSATALNNQIEFKVDAIVAGTEPDTIASINTAGLSVTGAVAASGAVSGATGAFTGNVTVGGTLSSTGNITYASDARRKTKRKTIRGALAKLLTLSGETFMKIGDRRRSMGIIAQDVQAVFPEAIRKDQDGYLTVVSGWLDGAVVEALKEINERLKALEARK